MNKRKYLLPLLLIVWIVFIFCNSLQTAEVSGSESRWLLDLLQQLGMDGLTNHILRKTAHFTEFAVLGVLARLLMGRHFRASWSGLALSLSVGLFIAVCDETIQLFVAGRAGMLVDVWLDFAGAATGAIAATLVLRFRAMAPRGLCKGD